MKKVRERPAIVADKPTRRTLKAAAPRSLSSDDGLSKQLMTMPDDAQALLLLDLTTDQVLASNLAAGRLLGYEAASLVGWSYLDLLLTESQPLYLRQKQLLLNGQTHENHQIALNNTGRPVYLRVSARPVSEQGQALGLLAFQTILPPTMPSIKPVSDLTLDSQTEVARDLKPLLNLVLYQLKLRLAYTSQAVYSWQEGEFQLLECKADTLDQGQCRYLHLAMLNLENNEETLAAQVPVLVEDVAVRLAQSGELADFQTGPDAPYQALTGSWLALPLVINGRLVGAVGIGHDRPGCFTPRELEGAGRILNQGQAAYYRFYDRVQNQAVQGERQRMARELHDSVSQIFYAIQLEASTARSWLAQDKRDQAQQRLGNILAQAETGLIEMRALLFELRPDALLTEGLVNGLKKQAAAVQALHGLEVLTELDQEPVLPLEIKEAIYRVGQEALQNAARHARPRQIKIGLTVKDGQACLSVRDDGQGFDPTSPFPGHFGLVGMRERAGMLGGQLSIESQPGQGSLVQLCFSLVNP